MNFNIDHLFDIEIRYVNETSAKNGISKNGKSFYKDHEGKETLSNIMWKHQKKE